MELKQLIEKWTKEMADIKSHIKQHEDTFGHPAVTSRERLEAISDMLADVKQLNLPPVINWVALSDKMPTKEVNGEKLLIYRIVNKNQRNMAMSIHDTYLMKNCNANETWWMELPKPPCL